jgi:hypothetical protein
MFLFFIELKTPLGHIQLPVQWVLTDFFTELKRPGNEAQHSSQSSTNVKTVINILPVFPLTDSYILNIGF